MPKTILGNERRLKILPDEDATADFAGPDYNIADQMPAPGLIGVKRDDTLTSVFSAIKGVAYYTDMIGFGESSTFFTSGMPVIPLGVNYFMKTGQTCSNGANMYSYVEGIPRGDALGKTATKVLKDMGLPSLKGTAPGVIEDTKEATNPMPVINALFGGAYPVCEQITRPVGDYTGSIYNIDGKKIINGDMKYGDNGKFYQTRWVQSRTVNKKEYDCTSKTHYPDGTLKPESKVPELPDECYYEEFINMGEISTTQKLILLAILGGLYIGINKILKK
jgi:hypothetical protein